MNKYLIVQEYEDNITTKEQGIITTKKLKGYRIYRQLDEFGRSHGVFASRVYGKQDFNFKSADGDYSDRLEQEIRDSYFAEDSFDVSVEILPYAMFENWQAFVSLYSAHMALQARRD